MQERVELFKAKIVQEEKEIALLQIGLNQIQASYNSALIFVKQTVTTINGTLCMFSLQLSAKRRAGDPSELGDLRAEKREQPLALPGRLPGALRQDQEGR